MLYQRGRESALERNVAVTDSESLPGKTLCLRHTGVGFAPLRPGAQGYLINLMEGVEDIPGAVLEEGIDWGAWETFEQYLGVLGGRQFTMDVGCLLAHGCVRTCVTATLPRAVLPFAEALSS